MWRSKRNLEWCVYKPKDDKGCWKPPESNNWKRDMAHTLPHSLQKALTLLTPQFQTPVLQNCGTMNSCCLEPPNLWQYKHGGEGGVGFLSPKPGVFQLKDFMQSWATHQFSILLLNVFPEKEMIERLHFSLPSLLWESTVGLSLPSETSESISARS